MPFPQHPRKHLEKPLFTATDFHRYLARRQGERSPRPPRSVVLVFGRRWKKYLDRRFRGKLDPRTDVYRVTASVGVTRLGPGAPLVAMVIEELAALGVRRFVIVGLAGSLQPRVRGGSLVLCTKALRDEGTSHHYVGSGTFAHPSSTLTASIRAVLKRSGAPFEEGASWTTDAPYRETVAEVRRFRKKGVLAVEMEASAAFAVARVVGCESAALFVVSDNLDEHGWEPRFHDTSRPLHHALDIAIAALRRGRPATHR